MAEYIDYKPTQSLGFEKIPSEWDIKKIKYLFSIGRGRVIAQEELMVDGLYPVYSSQTQNNGCLGYINSFDFDCDQLTWTTDGANAGTIFIRSGKHNCTNVCGTLQLKSSLTFLKFIYYALQYAAQFHKRPDTNGAKIMNNEMAEIGVATPSILEQDKIVEFLDHETAQIDTLIDKQQTLIQLLKEKRQAVISHAVTKGLNPDAPMKDSGVEWLGEVPEHWRVCSLKHIKAKQSNAFVDGPFGSNLKSIHFVDDGDVFVIESNFATTGLVDEKKLKTITLNHFNTISRSEAKAGDIILAKIGARFGMSSILPKLTKRSVVSGNSLKLTLDSDICNTEYIKFLLQHLKNEGAMDDGVNVTAQPALSLGGLNNLPVLLPPYSEQNVVIEELHKLLYKLSDLTNHAEQAIQLMQERRTALISAAVTGKIDVRGWVAPDDVL